MANAWDSAKGRIEKHAAESGMFVRLANNGDAVVGVFCGDPFAREVIWVGDKYEIYDSSNPAHQTTGKRPSMKVAINFFVLPEGEMKIIEGSAQWFRDLLTVRDKYGLENWSFEVKRHGEPKDPKTKYTILPEERIDKQIRERVVRADLHDIEAVLLNGGSPKEDATSELIDENTSLAVIARMKGIPREEVESILGRLGVAKVRGLKASDVERVLELADAYLSGTADEDDPFS